MKKDGNIMVTKTKKKQEFKYCPVCFIAGRKIQFTYKEMMKHLTGTGFWEHAYHPEIANQLMPLIYNKEGK
jgi:hypothetical protein